MIICCETIVINITAFGYISYNEAFSFKHEAEAPLFT